MLMSGSLAVGTRHGILMLLSSLLPILPVLLTSATPSTELLLPPLMSSLPSSLLAVLPQWSLAVSHEVAWLAAVVAFLQRSSSSSLATSPSVRTAGPIVAELLTTVAPHVAQIWTLLGPAARSGSSRPRGSPRFRALTINFVSFRCKAEVMWGIV